MYAKDFRARARVSMASAQWLCVGILLVYGAILSAVSWSGIGVIILAGPLELGVVGIFMALANQQPIKFGDMFNGFNDFSRSIITGLLKAVYAFLWALLFFIPGLIKSYSYAASMYIIYKDPTISANEAITKSRQIMNGHKWRLFCLRFSFIGWMLLSALTCGILYILYVGPYMCMAEAEFFKELLKEHYPEQSAPYIDSTAPNSEEA